MGDVHSSRLPLEAASDDLTGYLVCAHLLPANLLYIGFGYRIIATDDDHGDAFTKAVVRETDDRSLRDTLKLDKPEKCR